MTSTNLMIRTGALGLAGVLAYFAWARWPALPKELVGRPDVNAAPARTETDRPGVGPTTSAASEQQRAAAPQAPQAPQAPPRVAAKSPPAFERPDALTPAEAEVRRREHEDLAGRWERDERDPEATPVVEAEVASALDSRHVPANALQRLECRRTMCRAELATVGLGSRDPLEEVDAIIGAVRDLPEQNWVLARESRRDVWVVETFVAREGQALNGPVAALGEPRERQ